MNEDYLMHYGRIGMKWGQHLFGADLSKRIGRAAPIHRSEVKSRLASVKDKLVNAKEKTEKYMHERRSERLDDSSRKKEKDINDMSLNELNEKIKLERAKNEYREVTKKDPTLMQELAKSVTDSVKNVAVSAITEYATDKVESYVRQKLGLPEKQAPAPRRSVLDDIGSDPSSLSFQELREATNRAKMEQEYHSVMEKRSQWHGEQTKDSEQQGSGESKSETPPKAEKQQPAGASREEKRQAKQQAKEAKQQAKAARRQEKEQRKKTKVTREQKAQEVAEDTASQREAANFVSNVVTYSTIQDAMNDINQRRAQEWLDD